MINASPVQHLSLHKTMGNILGGGFGPRIQKLQRLALSFYVLCFCCLYVLFDMIPCNMQEQIAPVTPVEVVGVIRGSEKPSIFVPANDPSSAQWFYVDVPAIARAFGLPENTIYIEDINENVNPSRPYPIPKDANTLIRNSVMPQDHLNYTLTWYSLSAAVTFMAFKRLMPKKNR